MLSPKSVNSSAIALSLFRDLLTGQWFVCRIDMSFGNMTNQILFNAAVELEKAFCPLFADRLTSYLPRRPEAQVTVDNEVDFIFDQLTLTGIRVIAMKVMDGVQMVVVRFTKGDGKLTAVLMPDFRPDRSVSPPEPEPGMSEAAPTPKAEPRHFSRSRA